MDNGEEQEIEEDAKPEQLNQDEYVYESEQQTQLGTEL